MTARSSGASACAQDFVQTLRLEARLVDEEQHDETRERLGVEQWAAALSHRGGRRVGLAQTVAGDT